MKQTYINPEIKIVNVQTTQMVCVSSFDETVDIEGKNGSYSLSRLRRNAWSEEEEMEMLLDEENGW